MRGATKAAGMAAGATAVALQPGGLRRVGAGCLLVLLIGVLVMGGGIAALAWWASRPPAGLPCPPAAVRVTWGTPKPPQAAREAVTAAVERSGRKVRAVGAGKGPTDVQLIWTAGSPLYVGTVERPVVVRVGTQVTATQIRAALAERDHLPTCGAASPTEEHAPAAEPVGHAWRWPWQTAPTLAATAAVVLAAWWAVGPEVARLTGRGLRAATWPVRLGWRRWERFLWRRWTRGVKDEWPVLWPALPSRGQRWAEDPGALKDHRGPRRQDRDGGREPQRKAALRVQIAKERARDREQRRKDLITLREQARAFCGRGKTETEPETPAPAEELEEAR